MFFVLDVYLRRDGRRRIIFVSEGVFGFMKEHDEVLVSIVD